MLCLLSLVNPEWLVIVLLEKPHSKFRLSPNLSDPNVSFKFKGNGNGKGGLRSSGILEDNPALSLSFLCLVKCDIALEHDLAVLEAMA